MKLNGKTILVTGSSTGIGKAIARRCLEEGASVMIHGLEAEEVAQCQSDLDPEGSKTGTCVQDLSSSGAPEFIIQATLERFGQLDGLVNNAAAVGTGRIEDTEEAAFDQFMAINIRAPFFLIQAALEALEATRGNVVNIGSVNAYCGEPDLLPYSISKGALMTLSRNLGDTLHRERGIRVNQVNPGWILTENERQRKQDQGLPEDWPKLLGDFFAPSGRIFDPAEVAAAVAYFLSEECGPISGSVLDIEQHPFIGRNPAKVVKHP